MINANSITNALFLLIASDATIVSCGVTVQQLEPYNNDPKLMPWIGVYDGNETINPHTIGGNQPWQSEFELNLYIQTRNNRSAPDAVHDLQELQFLAMSVVNSNKKISGQVLMTTGFTVKPFQRDFEKSWRCFANQITIKTDVRG